MVFTKKCPYCDKSFTTKRKSKTFCSKKCSDKFHITSLPKKCVFCDKTMFVKPCLLNRKKYCSKKCQYLHAKELMKGTNNPFYGKTHSPETIEKLQKINFGRTYPKMENSPCWKGGKYLDNRGRVLIYAPDRINHIYKYTFESRIIMEKHLDRPLSSTEVVHHRNFNPSDNRIENLKLFPNQSAHMKFHRSLKTPK